MHQPISKNNPARLSALSAAWARVQLLADDVRPSASMQEVRQGLVQWSEAHQAHPLVVVAQSIASEALLRASSASDVAKQAEALIARLAEPVDDSVDAKAAFGNDYRQAIRSVLAGAGILSH